MATTQFLAAFLCVAMYLTCASVLGEDHRIFRRTPSGDYNFNKNYSEETPRNPIRINEDIFLVPASLKEPGTSAARKTYVFSKIKTSWFKARDLCESSGLQIASILSSIEQEYYLQDFKATGLDLTVWLGGNNFEGEGSSFFWASTCSRAAQPLLHTYWYSGEPNNPTRHVQCIQAEPSGKQFHWNDDPCKMQFTFACNTVQ